MDEWMGYGVFMLFYEPACSYRFYRITGSSQGVLRGMESDSDPDEIHDMFLRGGPL
jgi:hypothetical protein